jgi:DNA topoisomerase IB
MGFGQAGYRPRVRLRRSDPAQPGLGRRRCGRGFTYLGVDGRPLTRPGDLARCRDLVIPPAWKDVWICPDPQGHLQATGVDVAGRRQYLYHPLWRERRDRRKFNHVREVAQRLPRLRRRVGTDLGDACLSRRRVLALAARLIDRGLFRVGGDEYPTHGVATLLASHVRRDGTTITFRYAAKGGVERECTVRDRAASAAIRALLRHRRGRQRLLAFRDDNHGWREVHAADINDYLRAASGLDMTAKDLRTWHATVVAAVGLARQGPARSKSAARRAVARVMRDVAEELGNTPTIARASYVDPVVIESYLRGATIEAERSGPAAERAVLNLLND